MSLDLSVAGLMRALGLYRRPRTVRHSGDIDLGHEFRTPLNAVIGLSDALLRDESDPLTDRQGQAVTEIRSAGRRLLDLVEAEIDPSGEAPPASVSPMPVAPGPVVPEPVVPGPGVHEPAARLPHAAPPAVPSPANAVERRRVDARRAVADLWNALAEPARMRRAVLAAPRTLTADGVMGDPRALEAVLSAMAREALNGCRPGAVLAAEVRRGRDFVEIVIAARQPLVPSRETGAAGPFASGGPDAAAPFDAIDLTEARRLAVAMNGQLEPGRLSGRDQAEFGPGLVLLLPPAGAARAVLSSEGATAARPRPILLYVEDHPANVLLMRRVIAALGDFDLFIAETGGMGLAMALDLRPDLILLDINLPDLDGFVVKTRLAGDATTRAIPVIAVTANVSPPDVRRGREAGFFAYVAKPLDVPTFATALEAGLSGAGSLHQAVA